MGPGSKTGRRVGGEGTANAIRSDPVASIGFLSGQGEGKTDKELWVHLVFLGSVITATAEEENGGVAASSRKTGASRQLGKIELGSIRLTLYAERKV